MNQDKDRPRDPDREFFEDPRTWDAFSMTAPMREKIHQLRNLIPAGRRRILDLGCGNGLTTNELGREHEILGVDFSLPALRFVEAPRVCASATALPLCAGAFDLVLCSELLEHLSDADLRAAVSEILRLRARYLLLSVPNHENIHLNEVRCRACGRIFNASHHYRRFTAASLAALFPGYVVRQTAVGGPPVRAYPLALLRIRQRLGGRWFQVPRQRTVMCPGCRNTRFPGRCYNPVSFACDALNKLISRRHPYWLYLLLEGEDGVPASAASAFRDPRCGGSA